MLGKFQEAANKLSVVSPQFGLAVKRQETQGSCGLDEIALTCKQSLEAGSPELMWSLYSVRKDLSSFRYPVLSSARGSPPSHGGGSTSGLAKPFLYDIRTQAPSITFPYHS